jgi:hypothetical protein
MFALCSPFIVGKLTSLVGVVLKHDCKAVVERRTDLANDISPLNAGDRVLVKSIGLLGTVLRLRKVDNRLPEIERHYTVLITEQYLRTDLERDDTDERSDEKTKRLRQANKNVEDALAAGGDAQKLSTLSEFFDIWKELDRW